MKNITLITSVINTPNLPLSYTRTRSVFTKEERFEQLKKTIETVREKIPETQICLVECSYLYQNEREYLISAVDYFINIYETQNMLLIQRMFTISKSMGEGTMTMYALQYLNDNNIGYDNLFKISGRYWLNDTFLYKLYDNFLTCTHRIGGDINNVFTCFYKLSKDDSRFWLDYLKNSENDFINCIGFEVIFAKFIKSLKNKNVIIENKVGINGYVSICGSYIDM
jgi:hypothetical protein